MNIVERLAACAAAAVEHYGTPAGSGIILSIRFGLPLPTVAKMGEAAMWKAQIESRERKRQIKLGLDEEDLPVVVPLEPSRRMIDAGLRFARCAPGDMPKGCSSMRTAAWEAGWETRCTRWIGMVPKRKKKGDEWRWEREHRVALFLERGDGRRAVAYWTNGGWEQGWSWMPGEFRTMIGNRALLAVVKDGSL